MESNKTRSKDAKKRERESAREPEPEPKKAKKAEKAPSKKAEKPKAPPKKSEKPAPIIAKKGKKEESKIDISVVSKLLMAKISGKTAKGLIKELKKGDTTAAEKPKPAAKKKKAAEIGDDVAEVEKILGMRVDASGGLEFQIQWKQKGKMGKTTWEPEENIMDDDLVDDFEEAQQVKVYGSQEIKTGSEVEVKNIMEGFQNSWALASVTSKKGDKFSVSYTNFVEDDGSNTTEKGVERTRLRLVPEKVSGWAPVLGEIIEVNEDDCWWEAKVQQKAGKKTDGHVSRLR